MSCLLNLRPACIASFVASLVVLGGTLASNLSPFTTAVRAEDTQSCLALRVSSFASGSIGAVALHEPYAYVGVSQSVFVLDVSDPANPTVVGQSPPLGNDIIRIAEAGSTLYATFTHSRGVAVVDVSDPSNPAVIEELPDALVILASANRIYRAQRDGITIFGADDPLLQRPQGAWRTSATLGAVADSFIYLDWQTMDSYGLGGYGIDIVDVTLPSSPSLVQHIDLATIVNRPWADCLYVAADDDRAAVGLRGGRGSDEVFLVSATAGAPISALMTNLPPFVEDLTLDGTHLFYLTELGLYVMDPGIAPGFKASPAVASRIAGLQRVSRFAADPNLGVLSNGATLMVLDLSDPTNPRPLGSIDTPFAEGLTSDLRSLPT